MIAARVRAFGTATSTGLCYPSPRPAMLLQIGGGPTREICPAISVMSLYPAGPVVRTVGADSRYRAGLLGPQLLQ